MKLLAQSARWVVNKQLAKVVWIDGALLLSHLIDAQDYYTKENQLDNDWFFYCTQEKIEEETTIKEKRQRKLIQEFEKLGMIETKIKWIPAKKYYRIVENKLLQIVGASSAKSSELDTPNTPTINNITTNNKDKEKNNNSSFDDFWSIYPNKKEKKNALRAYEKSMKETTHDRIMEWLEKYIRHIRKNNIEKRYIKQPATWLNWWCRDDEYDTQKEKRRLDISEIDVSIGSADDILHEIHSSLSPI